jgi:hypothetical protein
MDAETVKRALFPGHPSNDSKLDSPPVGGVILSPKMGLSVPSRWRAVASHLPSVFRVLP